MIDVPAGHLYLGENLDAKDRKRNGDAVLLDSSDLTTHGVIVGMTGSGKTGLGVVLLEEALLQGIPTLIIDPKGDLGNLLLTFPQLRPEDFAPWVEEGDPAEVATQWKDGLAGWDIEPERIQSLRDAAEFTIYTPGSISGVPLNIVGSLNRPAEGADPEIVGDEVEGFVSGLLNMVGIEADPLSSKEHILLTNLIEEAWAAGTDLDLPTLVAQVQTPPIKKLGVYEIESFYPAKERSKLAVTLNGLLASRAFTAWAEGRELNLDQLLRSSDDSKPACAIVSLSHLSDEERQFVVSLLLGKLITWMRRQAGTSKLRTLVYFDEVMGFVPPNGAPPAKKPILTLYKQARAFGVGMVLATQNPVDVDYKGLSNAGTWMIGRLQTEQDKARLLDGLTSAGGEVDVKEAGDTISSLGKREFMMRSAGSSAPSLFTTRWAMSYLRGPLTREQISQLMQGRYQRDAPAAPAAAPAPAQTEAITPADAAAPATEQVATPPEPAAAPAAAVPAAAVPPVVSSDAETVPVAPPVADGIVVRWLDPAAAWTAQVGGNPGGTKLAPAILARASLIYDDRKLDVRQDEDWSGVFFPLGPSFDPSVGVTVTSTDTELRDHAPTGLPYVLTDAPLNRKTFFSSAEKAVVDQLYRTRTHPVLRNRDVGLTAESGETPEAFAARCQAAASEAAQQAKADLAKKFDTRIARAQDAVGTAGDRVAQAEAAENTRKTSAIASQAGALLGAVFGRRRNAGSVARDIGSALGGSGRSAEASRRVESARNQIARKQEALATLQNDLADQLAEIDADWASKAAAVDTVEVSPRKSDIRVTVLTLLWIPVT
jgi:hypothetical protein